MVFSNNLLLGAGGQSTAGPTPFDPTLIGNSVWLDGSADFLKRDNLHYLPMVKKNLSFLCGFSEMNLQESKLILI
jgi:hypothetical protein